MVVNVRCYYDTGFNLQNIPYTADILTENFRPKTFPDCFLLQNKGLATLRINTSWNEIDGVDYLLIQTDTANVWYFVTGIAMLNENCAELQLVMDALTTCGLNNIEITSGWCIRRHVSDDSLFSNIIPEPFTPSNELVLDKGKELKLSFTTQYSDIVGATFNLAGTYNSAQEFKSGEGSTVVVPKIPTFPKFTPPRKPKTQIRMEYKPITNIYLNELPNLYLFILDSVFDNIMVARSLGLDMGITACYRVPNEWVGEMIIGQFIEPELIDSMKNNRGDVDSQLPFQYTTALNNKVFALFNNYVLSSICSGERLEFNADEIYQNTSSPLFTLWADLSPNGCPFARPQYYRGNNSDPFMMCVKGMNWQNTPLAFNIKSGAAFDVMRYNTDLASKSVAMTASNTKAVTDSLFTLASMTPSIDRGHMKKGGTYNVTNRHTNRGDILSGAQSLVNTAIDSVNENVQYGLSLDKMNIDWQQEQNYRVPEIRFPRDESIQNFIGNTFWVYRTRLSQNDVARFDKFLSMYGYAVDEALTDECFNCRQNFNYVVCRDVNIKVNQSSFIRRMAESQLEGGVRIWHTVPDSSYYTLPNPIVT